MVKTETDKTVLADETNESVMCFTYMAARGKPTKRGAQRRPATSFSRRPSSASRPARNYSEAASPNGKPENARPEAKQGSDTTHILQAKERSAYDGDTAIKLYLREIGQVKLLTPEEEIELAARIKKGDKKAREQMIKA